MSWHSNLAPKQRLHLCGFQHKMEVSKLYRPFINKFNSIILCSHPYCWKFRRSCGLRSKQQHKTLHKPQAVALQPDAEHASWLAQKSLKSTSLAFVIHTYSGKRGLQIFVLYIFSFIKVKSNSVSNICLEISMNGKNYCPAYVTSQSKLRIN